MAIIINNEQNRIKISKELEKSLFELAAKILQAHGREEAEVGINLTDLEAIQRLNREYRGIDAPTDVLAFSLEEGEDENLRLPGPELLGDVVICVPRAHRQAREWGHSFAREILYLTAHGLLHLLGYDHQNEVDKRRMREKEEHFLAEIGHDEE